jgi:hypothetical protein
MQRTYRKSRWHRFKQALKNHRNDWMLRQYLAKQTSGLGSFQERLLHRLEQLPESRYLLCIVAFERAEVIDLCLSSLRLHLQNAAVAVFDNSRSEEGRRLIAGVCADHGVPYLGLPHQTTRHANRSHGMAMTWIYERILRGLEIKGFGFIDHDLIAMDVVKPFAPLAKQEVYGALNHGVQAWNLWAGYCFFRSDHLSDKDVNFLYDFSRELDTGGRNWSGLYAPLPVSQVQFAKDCVTKQPWMTAIQYPVQLVDDHWLHVGGVSYNDNLSTKQSLFQALVDYINRLNNKL